MDVFHDYGTRKQILIMIVGKNHDDSQIKYICIDTTHVRHRQRKQEREREREERNCEVIFCRFFRILGDLEYVLNNVGVRHDISIV
jgi:hypothetical protein